MKKITSVFITVLVFIFGFLNITFAGQKCEKKRSHKKSDQKKKMPCVKTNDLQGTKKVTDFGQEKLTDLEKGASVDSKEAEMISSEKFENLEGADFKVDDLDTIKLKVDDLDERTGADWKVDDLDQKR